MAPTQASLLPGYKNRTIKSQVIRERADYRLAYTPDACTLSELLSILISGSNKTEIANNLLSKYGTIHEMATASIVDLASVEGIGEASALRIKASIEIGRKLLMPVEFKKMIMSPQDAAEILMPMLSHKVQESFFEILLDTRMRVINTHEIYRQTLNGAMVRVAEVFKPAIQQNADSIIVAHNHPSSDPSFSPEDVSLTRTLIATGKSLDITINDHLVIGSANFKSMKESGLGGFSN